MDNNVIDSRGQSRLASSMTLPTSGRKFRDAWVFGETTVIEVDWDKARSSFRSTATLDRITFVVRAIAAGFLAESDAEDAARGIWPSSFSDVLAAIPESQRLNARITWAGLNIINRNAAVLTVIAAVKEIDPKDLDIMFGYEGE